MAEVLSLWDQAKPHYQAIADQMFEPSRPRSIYAFVLPPKCFLQSELTPGDQQNRQLYLEPRIQGDSLFMTRISYLAMISFLVQSGTLELPHNRSFKLWRTGSAMPPHLPFSLESLLVPIQQRVYEAKKQETKPSPEEPVPEAMVYGFLSASVGGISRHVLEIGENRNAPTNPTGYNPAVINLYATELPTWGSQEFTDQARIYNGSSMVGVDRLLEFAIARYATPLSSKN